MALWRGFWGAGHRGLGGSGESPRLCPASSPHACITSFTGDGRKYKPPPAAPSPVQSGLLIALKAAETGAHALALFKGTLITLKQKQEEFTAGAQHFRFPLPLSLPPSLPLSFPAAPPVCAHQLFIQSPLLNDRYWARAPLVPKTLPAGFVGTVQASFAGRDGPRAGSVLREEWRATSTHQKQAV